MKPPIPFPAGDLFTPEHLRGQALIQHVQKNLPLKWGCDHDGNMFPFASESERLAWLRVDERRRVGGIDYKVRQQANLARRAADEGKAENLPAHLR